MAKQIVKVKITRTRKPDTCFRVGEIVTYEQGDDGWGYKVIGERYGRWGCDELPTKIEFFNALQFWEYGFIVLSGSPILTDLMEALQ